jgi:hypothetical protein
VYRPGEQRPFMRSVQWIENVNGHETRYEVNFANAHTPESRLAQHIPPASTGGAGADIIRVDFRLRQRIS